MVKIHNKKGYLQDLLSEASGWSLLEIECQTKKILIPVIRIFLAFLCIGPIQVHHWHSWRGEQNMKFFRHINTGVKQSRRAIWSRKGKVEEMNGSAGEGKRLFSPVIRHME